MDASNAINWFEIPVSDFERAKKFYQTLYSYQMPVSQMGPAKMGFLLYDIRNQKVGGAIVHNPEFYTPSDNGSLVYLNGGDDLQTILDKVEPAGGKVIMKKELISPEEDMGYWALILDTEGNRIGLHSMG